MKKIVYFSCVCVLLIAVFAGGCTSGKPINQEPINQADYLQLMKDSVVKLNEKINKLSYMATTYENYLVALENDIQDKADNITMLNDSIRKLNERPLMTKQQFLDLYKFERIKKYWGICQRNKSQYKYLNGWINRVFEE